MLLSMSWCASQKVGPLDHAMRGSGLSEKNCPGHVGMQETDVRTNEAIVQLTLWCERPKKVLQQQIFLSLVKHKKSTAIRENI